MKRIDLHIHTVGAQNKEETFEFDMDLLKAHVEEQRLDAIAITNHNLFDRQNYNLVKLELSTIGCIVFPGVELDAIGTHILIITDDLHVDAMETACKKLHAAPQNVNELIMSFPFIDSCLVIPHFNKDPSISNESLIAIRDYVDAVETSSLKKAIRLSKTNSLDVPVVCFTDFRFGGNGKPEPKSVYIDTDNLTITNVKAAMKSDRGIRYNIEGTDQLEIAPGILACDSLNLLIGKRSTGKTHTLERTIGLCDEGDVYYIKQGSLVADSTESQFEQYLSESFSSNIVNYYKRWIPILAEAKRIGGKSNRETKIRDYLIALKKYAGSSTMADSFSECHLFHAKPLPITDCSEYTKVIDALIVLLNAVKTKNIVEKYIGQDSLLRTLAEVVNKARQKKMESSATERANDISAAVKRKLTVRSSQDEYPTPVLSSVFHDQVFYLKSAELLERCWEKRDIYNDRGKAAGKYIVHIAREPYTRADTIKRKLGIEASLKGMAGKNAAEYLDTFIGLPGCVEHPSALFNLVVRVKDQKGADLSGGQRTEFIFMDKLREAESYSVILIDEPESSFDNIFLNEQIANKIRSLASHSTVFVTSHNQVLSFALQPKKVFYTSYDPSNRTYEIYAGELSDDNLKNKTGEARPTRQTMQALLEAGEKSFEQRRTYYEGA